METDTPSNRSVVPKDAGATSNPHAGLNVRRVPIQSLVPDSTNPRLHGPINLDSIESSLRRFGQAEPLVIQKDTMRVIAGHGRLQAMRKLGWTDCDVVELDIDGMNATALGIALNRTAESATWDEPVLAKLLEELQREDALEGVGFTDSEINELFAQLAVDSAGEIKDPGPVEPPANPVTRPGDLWILGGECGHRLLCGDSTNEDEVARLMGSMRASLLATDPPYLVDYKGGNHPQSWANRPETRDKHWDDYEDPVSAIEFFQSFLRVALGHCIERVPIYQWHATRRQALVEEAWKANGLLVHQTIVWAKAHAVLTHCHFMWQHEPCFYGWPEGHMPENDRKPPPNETTVWQVDQVGQQDGIHPTQKPLALFERPIEWHTRPGEVCLEPFCGSGTQLVAAEKLGRRCYAGEVSASFVDAALLRWEGASGKKATLESSGKTFAEVAAERGAPCSSG